MADVFYVVCGVDIVSSWEAGGPCRNTGGCDTVVRYAELADKELRMCTAVLVALVGRGIINCGMNEMFFL